MHSRPHLCPSLQEIIDSLVGAGDASDEDNPDAGHGDTAVANEGRDEDLMDCGCSASSAASTNEETTVPIVEARLHSLDVERLLDMAPSAAAREAWTTGRALPHQRRCLLLARSQVETRDELYEEGRQWWEDHAECWSRSWVG